MGRFWMAERGSATRSVVEIEHRRKFISGTTTASDSDRTKPNRTEPNQNESRRYWSGLATGQLKKVPRIRLRTVSPHYACFPRTFSCPQPSLIRLPFELRCFPLPRLNSIRFRGRTIRPFSPLVFLSSLSIENEQPK